MKFYFTPRTCSLATHIALEEAGAAYEAIRLDFASADHARSEYLAVNPKGRVPALETERGVLTETPALLVYVAQRYPQAGLIPEDPFDLARVQALNAYLCATVHVAHSHRPRGSRWADDPAALAAMKAKVPENMAACFALIEREMLAGPWVLGARYSIADPYLFTVSGWLKGDGVDIAGYPRVAAHSQRMCERPAVQRALAQSPAG